MLKPWYFIGKASRMLALYDQLEDWIMRDIARRLFAAGKLTATADREIWKLQQMGLHRREIEKKLAKLTGKSRAEIRALLQDAVVASWDDDRSVLEKLGQFFSGPLDNPEVRRVMDAEYAKSQGELSNLTRSTMLASQKKLIELLDAAEMRTAAGVQSYDEAVAEILDAYAGEGAKVSYPTGREMSIEAAVRMCVVTSMNQTAAQVTNKYIKEAGTNYVLTSAHYGARVKSKNQPDLAGHDLWQGRVFCIRGSEPGIPNLLESTGYDIDPVTGVGRVVNPLGLHGYNCRHSHQPWDKRLRNPWRDKDGNLLDGNGNIITPEKNREVFENLQKQRAMERKIRQTKRRLLMKQEEINAATDPAFKSKLEGEYAELSERLTAQNREYNEFCKRHNLQPDYARTKAMGFGVREQKTVDKAVKVKRRELSAKEEYINAAKPGTGIISIDDGYDKGKHILEIKFADWLHSTMGGNIRLLAESTVNGVKRPDYLWKNKLWDLKSLTTEKAANSAIHSGLKQIRENPGGIFLNYDEYTPDMESLKTVIVIAGADCP